MGNLGMLTFCLYFLMKNPEAMRRAREEVDEVLGDQEIQIGDLSKLKYVTGQCNYHNRTISGNC